MIAGLIHTWPEGLCNRAKLLSHGRYSNKRNTMTYEEYLNEVTTLIYELYGVSEADAVKFVVRAQASDFFNLHDEDVAMRTQERAEQDAKTIYEQRNKSNPKVFRKQR
jgi:hypothetical protein